MIIFKIIYCLLCTGHRFSQPHILFTVYCFILRVAFNLVFTVYFLLSLKSYTPFTVYSKTVNSTKITVQKKKNSTIGQPCVKQEVVLSKTRKSLSEAAVDN